MFSEFHPIKKQLLLKEIENLFPKGNQIRENPRNPRNPRSIIYSIHDL